MNAEVICRLRDVAVITLQGSDDELTFEDFACLGQGDALVDETSDEVLKQVAQVLSRALGNAVVCAELLQGESRAETAILAQIRGLVAI